MKPRPLIPGLSMWSKAMATSSLKVTRVWPLEKYARFMPVEDRGQVLPQQDSAQKKAGNWKVSGYISIILLRQLF